MHSGIIKNRKAIEIIVMKSQINRRGLDGWITGKNLIFFLSKLSDCKLNFSKNVQNLN